MKRNCLMPQATAIGGAFAAVILAGVLFTSVPVRADIDVRINIGNAPPAPRLVFQARPHERFYPGQGIYVVDDPRMGDYDCFRYGGFYWMFRDGYWYRSPSWRSRFVVIHPRYVPAVFYQMPPTRWKHHPNGPPDLTGRRPSVPQRDMRESGPRPPGLAKKGVSGPPGHANKGGNNDDKGNRGKK
jgi:hypothetical protein